MEYVHLRAGVCIHVSFLETEKARRVEVSTISNRYNGQTYSPDDDNVDDGSKIMYLPSVSNTYNLWYKRHWVQVNRVQTQGYYGRMESSLSLTYSSLASLHPSFLDLPYLE